MASKIANKCGHSSLRYIAITLASPISECNRWLSTAKKNAAIIHAWIAPL